MHRLAPNPPAPTHPFSVGPYIVIPTPLRGLSNTLYTITFNGKVCGQQISRPDRAQCADREREQMYGLDNGPRRPVRRARFNSAAPIVCKTCKTEKPRSLYYRVDGYHKRLMKSCKVCVDAGLAQV